MVAPLFVFIGVTGFIIANSVAGALALFPQRVGTASALVGAIQYGSGIVGSALIAVFADGTPWPMGWVVALSGLGSCACAWLVISPASTLKNAEPTAGRTLTFKSNSGLSSMHVSNRKSTCKTKGQIGHDSHNL